MIIGYWSFGYVDFKTSKNLLNQKYMLNPVFHRANMPDLRSSVITLDIV